MRAFTHAWAGLLPLLAGLAACGGGPMAAMDDTPYFVARGRYPARDKLPTLTEDADHVLRGQGFVDIGALYVDGVGTEEGIEKLLRAAAARRGADRVQVLRRGPGFLPKAQRSIGGVLWRQGAAPDWETPAPAPAAQIRDLEASPVTTSIETLDVECRAGRLVACATIAASLARAPGLLGKRVWSERFGDYLVLVLHLAQWHCERGDAIPACRYGAQITTDAAQAADLARRGCEAGDQVACGLVGPK
ncbi:MAG: hypothetical protein KC549_06960 [Myxococcales bacterium]|nr:hypothetical protein [Myxococcales bacterium]MCB9546137.1 hypothetical protein [Myxococcales bacterium]